MTALHDAIAEQLRALLSQGINAKTLAKIERFARAQREALIAVDSGESALDARLATIGLSALTAPEPQTGQESGSFPNPFPLASAPEAETYGANVMREIMGPLQAALGRIAKPQPKVSELVVAIADAETAGLDDALIASLRAKLDSVLKDDDEPPPMIDATSPSASEFLASDPRFGSAFIGGLAMGMTGGLKPPPPSSENEPPPAPEALP